MSDRRRLGEPLADGLIALEQAVWDAEDGPLAETMTRHRAEWPDLWAAIDLVRDAASHQELERDALDDELDAKRTL